VGCFTVREISPVKKTKKMKRMYRNQGGTTYTVVVGHSQAIGGFSGPPYRKKFSQKVRTQGLSKHEVFGSIFTFGSASDICCENFGEFKGSSSDNIY